MENQSNEETLVKKMAELYVTYRKRYILCLPSGSIITPKKKNGYHST